MDLLIKQDSYEVKLSQLGIYNINIDDSSPSIEIDRRTVKGRSGYIHDGVTLRQKKIKVTGRLAVAGLQAFMEKKDDLIGLLCGDAPYYVTKMYPDQDDLYSFELPGTKTGDLNLLTIPHTAWKYRYKVNLNNEIEFSFIGKSEQGLKYNLAFELVTAEMPFGETIPKDIVLSGGMIPYAGTAAFSQLEVPYTVELTSSASQTSFFLEIDGRRWTYNHSATPIQEGEKLLLTGVESRIYKGIALPDLNINARTNYEYFVIKPNPLKQVRYSTNFRGTVKVLGFKELYK
ncbi:phage tail protein [Streptococcus panodentis]|uniref:Phage tail protein n=1 Tax=Streptococcus panodentis TaxID=1581472 RepID=A0ABS5AX12_9STRE|nr:phage tail protein [Streptococcus panodentis]MBP2621119.1 phage tail protein [Streptococcus panodentis]